PKVSKNQLPGQDKKNPTTRSRKAFNDNPNQIDSIVVKRLDRMEQQLRSRKLAMEQQLLDF
ncbi:unnamed protein product, partial [Dovyalis caffra]